MRMISLVNAINCLLELCYQHFLQRYLSGSLAFFFPKFFIPSQFTSLLIHSKEREWIANLFLAYFTFYKLRARNGSHWSLFKITGSKICQEEEKIGLGLLPPANSFPIRPNRLVASINQKNEIPGGTDMLLSSDELDIVKPTLQKGCDIGITSPSCLSLPIIPVGPHPLVLLL